MAVIYNVGIVKIDNKEMRIDPVLYALAAGKNASAECRAAVAVCFVCLALRAKTRPSFPG